LKDIEKYIEEEVKRKKKAGRKKERSFERNELTYQTSDLDSATLQEIIQDHHNHELVRHSDYTKTHELITWSYW